MYKKIILLILIIFTVNSIGFAQTFQFGLSASTYKEQGSIINSYDPGASQGVIYNLENIDNSSILPGVVVYYYQPIIKSNYVFSVGIQGGVEAYAIYKKQQTVTNYTGQYIGTWGSETSLQAGYKVPISILARFGNLSVKKNYNSFGFAAGFGISPHGFSLPLDRAFYLSPNLCCEISYEKISLRFNLPLNNYNSYYTSTTGDIPRLTSSFWSINLTKGIYF